MTDNEKRAHDLAVAFVSINLHTVMKDAQNTFDNTSALKSSMEDVCKVYASLYEYAKEELNKG